MLHWLVKENITICNFYIKILEVAIGGNHMQEPILGLSTKEVMEHRKTEDEGNLRSSITKTNTQIVKENIFTLFNLLNFIIAALLLGVGAYSNLLFIAIIILNISIGIAQELKAKKMVDNLSILNRPHVTVLRDGKELLVETEEIVKDDVMVLDSGKQICNDAVVLRGSLEVNESLLTGESDAVIKEEGDELYSGSFVISGRCYAKVIHVGSENYATKLADDVKKEKQVHSELLGAMKKVTRFTSFLIVPLGILLFIEAMLLRHMTFADSIITSSAALLGMLPKGLVLLISVSLATGVIRLAKMKILVQNIYSLETLAHVDVLCLDKTGTITDGKMKVKTVIPMTKLPKEETDKLIQSYLAACNDNNATFQALEEEFSAKAIYSPVDRISFSSHRKWGAISFSDMGTVFVGAPERMMKQLPRDVEEQMEAGYRVVVIGYCKRMWNNENELPEDIQPMYIAILTDTIRKNTRQTLEYFRNEGVDVKVISGDHLKTVSIIAKKAGLERWNDAIDLSTVGEDVNYDKICKEYAVFARVTPKQKQQLVQALKRQGHHVAMTGDGVNDLLALREADCSIAVAEGSDASRQISQIVLLNSDFTHLPQVVLEGRKVVNNVTRTAGVFFIKTIYSILVSLFCILLNIPFPFIPIQITLIDAFIEAAPSFLTIFESNTRRIHGGFLKKVLGNAAPFALSITIMIVIVSLTTPFDSNQNQTIMYLLLMMTSMVAVVKSCIPFTKLRVFTCATMILGAFGALVVLPSLFEVCTVTFNMLGYLTIALAGMVILTSIFMKLKKIQIIRIR